MEENTVLIAAVQKGDVRAVEDLLVAGADPNVSDSAGQTPLHHAMQARCFDIAACLLSYAADHRITNRQGCAPLTSKHVSPEDLHQVRQRFHRFRTMGRAKTSSGRDGVEHWTQELQRAGIVKISGLIQPDVISALKDDFGEFIQELDLMLSRNEGTYQFYDEELHYWTKDRAYVTNNVFKYSAALVRLCCDPTIVEIMDGYLRREAQIQRGLAMRYLPAESSEKQMFGWHHDMEEQRLKMMILLTDIGETDQYMSYVVGSNKIFHPYEMFFKNQCSLDYCRDHLGSIEIFKTTGQTGDIFLFDSNGSHRGNRSLEGAVRDVYFIEYSADNSEVWGGDIDPDWLAAVDPRYARVFRNMLSVEKKWNLPRVRTAPTWIENLPHIERWLQ